MFNSKWRVKIVNETLEFDNAKELKKAIGELIKLKEDKKPYDNKGVEESEWQ